MQPPSAEKETWVESINFSVVIFVMIQHMETSLSLKYTGPAVDEGRMDVYAASANMIAFSEFVVVAAKATFGEQANARAEVAGFGRGSFITNLLFSFSGEAASIFSAFPSDHLLDVIKGSFELWKHLQGKPPQKVEHRSQSVMVTNNNGQIIQVQTQSLHLVMNEKASESVERFVRMPLSMAGIDSIQLSSDQGLIGDANKQDAAYFVPVAPSETMTDVTVPMGLVIESPSFKDGNKWKFFDGTQSVFIEMLDQDFIDRINNGERFGKGDVLMAEVRFVQKRSGMKLEAERSIVKVLEHKQGQYQPPLS